MTNILQISVAEFCQDITSLEAASGKWELEVDYNDEGEHDQTFGKQNQDPKEYFRAKLKQHFHESIAYTIEMMPEIRAEELASEFIDSILESEHTKWYVVTYGWARATFAW
jgi:hypothetical protein